VNTSNTAGDGSTFGRREPIASLDLEGSAYGLAPVTPLPVGRCSICTHPARAGADTCPQCRADYGLPLPA
jgi:hypothetical protein